MDSIKISISLLIKFNFYQVQFCELDECGSDMAIENGLEKNGRKFVYFPGQSRVESEVLNLMEANLPYPGTFP